MTDSQPNTTAQHRSSRAHRLRFAPFALVAGVVASAALALSLNGTLAAFTAQITNSSNTVSDGTLIMTEQQTAGSTTVAAGTCSSTDGGSVYANTSTCSTINKYGGVTNLVPGGSSSATVTLTNTGTVAASTFSLTPNACTQGPTPTPAGAATNLCSKMTISVTKTVGANTSTVVPAGTTLAAFGAMSAITNLGPVASQGSASFTFTVTLPAGLDNTYQGLSVSQPMVWQFSAGS